MNVWKGILIGFGILAISLFLMRLVLPKQLDDVAPGISCEDELLNSVDVYYVIPKLDNIAINKTWCEAILARNKELAMHGVYHTFEEFGIYRDKEYFQEGVDIFEECFELTPERFKPGQLEWNKNNDWIRDEVEVDILWNQIFHKVYHCNDSGKFPNWLIRIF